MAEGSALRELIALFDIKVHKDELEAADKAVDGFKDKLEKAAKILAEAFAVKEVVEFIDKQVELGARLGDLSERLGISSTYLQEFQFGARLAGVEGESAAHSLGFLNKAIGEAVTGNKEAAKTFAELHVELKNADGTTRPLNAIVNDLSDSLKALPDQQTRATYAMKLFSREGQALLPMLTGGSEELERLRKEFEELGGGMSEDFVKSAKEVNDELAKVSLGMGSLRAIIAGQLLPYVKVAVDVFKSFVIGVIDLAKHTKILQTGMAILAAFAGTKLVSALWSVAQMLGLVKATAIETLFALGEFVLAAAPFIALFFVVEDLWSLLDGGKSVIGDLLDKFFGVGTAQKLVVLLRDTWKEVGAAIVDVSYALGYFFGVAFGLVKLVTPVDDIGKAFGGVVVVITSATRLLVGFIQALLSVPKALQEGSLDPILKQIDKAGDAVFGKGGLIGSNDALFGKNGLAPIAGGPDTSIPGLPPEAVALWNAHHTGKESTLGPGERYGAVTKTGPNSESRPILPAHVVPAPGNVTHGGTVVNHKSETSVVVHTSSDQPKAVGEAVGAGVSSATEKDLQNALASVVRP